VDDVVCSGCSLLCDDVSAEVSGKSVSSLGLCKLGHTHLEKVVMLKSESIEKKLEKAVDILLNAKNLLIYGWTHTTDEEVQEGLKLAEMTNGHFSSSTNLGPWQAMLHSIHSEGLAIDLEYVRNNGEFIIYWGSDPSESLHRHSSRFAVLPRGQKIPEGVESRTIGVVDVRKTETMKMANHRLIIPAGADAELLDVILSELEGKSVVKDKVLGIPGSELIGFVNGLRKSDCTVIFYGSGVINSGKYDSNLSGISKLIKAIRKTGKEAYALPMFVEPNTMGVIKAISQEEDDALQRMASGEFDVALIVSDDVLANLPNIAAKALARMQTVYVGLSGGFTDTKAKVSIHTNDPMTAGLGTMTRVDMKEISFKKWKTRKEHSTIRDVLLKMQDIIRGKKA